MLWTEVEAVADTGEVCVVDVVVVAVTKLLFSPGI
jgi:hypothetical protein